MEGIIGVPVRRQLSQDVRAASQSIV